jgi:hypothetical protein
MCGGLIHPIAGKCKHCKGDLAGLRGGRPAAAQQLPSIIATNGATPISNGHANGHSPYSGNHTPTNGANGHSAYAPVPMAAQHVAMPMQLARHYEEHSAPILPPRPTGRQAIPNGPRAAWWKSWPLIVILLAVVAIVTAVVLMVWPPGKSAAAEGEPTKANKMLPTPERMETNPLPPRSDNSPPAKSGDPWNDNQPGAKIDIPDDPDDDLAGGGTAPGGAQPQPPRGRSPITGGGAVMLEVSLHFCDRAATCSNDTLLQALCDQTKSSMKIFDVQPPTSCQSRTKCLEHVDALDCSLDFTTSALTQLTTKVQDCVEAITRC